MISFFRNFLMGYVSIEEIIKDDTEMKECVEFSPVLGQHTFWRMKMCVVIKVCCPDLGQYTFRQMKMCVVINMCCPKCVLSWFRTIHILKNENMCCPDFVESTSRNNLTI